MIKKLLSPIACLMFILTGLIVHFDNRLEKFTQTQQSYNIAFYEAIEAAAYNIMELRRTSAVSDVKVVTVTAYTPSPDETDEDPLITASMEPIRPGAVAVSRDLFKAGWVFGKKVYIEGVGVLTILDLMNERYINRIDVVMFSKKDAFEFGKKELAAVLLRL